MSETISTNKIKKNVIYSIAVQIVAICVQFILNLIVPKCISEIQYAHWQAYVLYVSYVGVLHFGLLDGLMLRYSQYDYIELDKPRIRSQFVSLFVINFVISVISIIIINLFLDGSMKYIMIFASIGIVTKNIFTYNSYAFQMTNRISKYAILVISQKTVYGILVVIFLFSNKQNFCVYCLADLIGDIVSCIVGYFYNKEIFFGSILSFNNTIKELWCNVSSGIILLIANWSSMLLIGCAKMIIQFNWSELVFGKVSFSFSISSLFLTFVTAISIVLFPSLKRMNKEDLPSLYINIRNSISPILFSSLVLYYPGCIILELWLPKYHDSLTYLGVLLPIIIYTSKVSLLTNNYLKAYREEKKMLIINIFSVILAFCTFLIATFLIRSLTVLLFSVVLMIVIRSVVSEIVVINIMGIKIVKDFIIEFLMTVIFIIGAKVLDFREGFIFYMIFLILYLFYYRENIGLMCKKIKKENRHTI